MTDYGDGGSKDLLFNYGSYFNFINDFNWDMRDILIFPATVLNLHSIGYIPI
jgi:hypothetical protein